MTDDTLYKELEIEKATLETKRQELEREIAGLERQREAISYRLGHVTALLRGSEFEGVDKEKKNDLHMLEVADEEPIDPIEIAHRVLEEHGTEPIHYRELSRMVIEKGGELEGTDPAMTLVSRLVADDRFVRPFRRGWYALRVHYPKVKSVGARRPRKSKRTHRG